METDRCIEALMANQKALYNFCRSKIHNAESAEDYLSEFNEKMLNKIYKGEIGFDRLTTTYLISSLLHHIIDDIRHRESLDKKLKRKDTSLSKVSDVMEAENLSEISIDDILKMCNELTPEEKQIIMYRCNTNKTFKELSEELGINSNTLRAHYWFGVNKLKEIVSLGKLIELSDKRKTWRMLSRSNGIPGGLFASLKVHPEENILTLN